MYKITINNTPLAGTRVNFDAAMETAANLAYIQASRDFSRVTYSVLNKQGYGSHRVCDMSLHSDPAPYGYEDSYGCEG
ncbi:MAG: hypothetical protein DRQ47_09105 [Gammaproteobacteria bacterium]|nr:MAG: hypothetical protein DRQ47_09105 [Gammaproteobacteria bacterium]